MLYIDKETYDIVMNKKNDESYFECDDNMAPIISVLNKKGYKTAYCCEGHVGFADNYTLIKNTDILDTRYKLFIATPYIKFDGDISVIIEIHPLPKGWSTNPSDFNTRIAYNNYASIDTLHTIFDPDDLTIYKYIVESKKRFQKAERELFDWAVSLPERD